MWLVSKILLNESSFPFISLVILTTKLCGEGIWLQGLASQGPCNLFGYKLIKEQENMERKETRLSFSLDGRKVKGRKRRLLPWGPHTWLSRCYSPNSTEEVVTSKK